MWTWGYEKSGVLKVCQYLCIDCVLFLCVYIKYWIWTLNSRLTVLKNSGSGPSTRENNDYQILCSKYMHFFARPLRSAMISDQILKHSPISSITSTLCSLFTSKKTVSIHSIPGTSDKLNVQPWDTVLTHRDLGHPGLGHQGNMAMLEWCREFMKNPLNFQTEMAPTKFRERVLYLDRNAYF